MYFLAASAAVSLLGAAASSSAQKEQAAANRLQAYTQAEYNKFEAANIREAAGAEADKILNTAKMFRATQATQQAASGVVIGAGSAGVMQQQTDKLATADALVALYNGARGATTQEATGRYTKQAGDNQYSAGMTSANATLMAGVASAATTLYSGFNKANTPKKEGP